MAVPPDISIINSITFKTLLKPDDISKKPYIVVNDASVDKKLRELTEDDILGMNAKAVEAILDGAVPPHVDWMKHIVLPIESGEAQEVGYTKSFPTQVQLLGNMQQAILEAILNKKAPLTFKSPLIAKYRWAFQKLGLDTDDYAEKIRIEVESARLDVKSVLDVYGKVYADRTLGTPDTPTTLAKTETTRAPDESKKDALSARFNPIAAIKTRKVKREQEKLLKMLTDILKSLENKLPSEKKAILYKQKDAILDAIPKMKKIPDIEKYLKDLQNITEGVKSSIPTSKSMLQPIVDSVSKKFIEPVKTSGGYWTRRGKN